MDTLVSMKVFAAVAESGSFTVAADRLDISRAMASKYVAHLEEHLGTRLLQRTTRKLTLTESGAVYYERCAQILADIVEAEAGALRLTDKPRGTLRLTMPVSFGLHHMGPIINAYLLQYPEVKIDILLNDRRVDLIEEGLDLAIRIGQLPESGLIAKKLGSTPMVICGAPDYFRRHGQPQVPADLARHNCLLYSYSPMGDEWKLRGPDGEHIVKVAGNLRASNGDMVRQAALGGIGLMMLPMFLVGEDLRAGRLVEIFAEYRREITIHAVYPSRKHLSAKVRTFVDSLANTLALKTEW